MYRLGNFHLDPEKQLLTAHGKQVHLSRKPYQVLLYLIENRSRLVSRGELLDRFWGGKEVYDQTLSKAVGAIRKALDEPREEEVFIETRWAAGYRYIGPFEELPEAAPDVPPSQILRPEETIPAQAGSVPDPHEARPTPPAAAWRFGRSSDRPRSHFALLAIAVLVISGGALWGRKHLGGSPATTSASSSAPRLEVRPSVAVFVFKNLSQRADEEWLGGALAEMLSTEMGADGRLRTVPGETIARAAKELDLAKQPGFALETLAAVRQNLGVDYVVTGAFTVVDAGREVSSHKLRLDICMQDTKSGETIATFANEANVQQLFRVVATSGTQIIESLRLPGISPKTEELARAALPANPAATRPYMEGLEKLRQQDVQGAQKALEKAVQADPDFPLAHLALADAWQRLGYLENERTEASRAFEMSAHLSRELQLYVRARYLFTSRDWNKTIETYQTLVDLYPDTIEYGLQLADAQSVAGKPLEARATIDRMRRLDSPAAQDPRLDMAESGAARAVSDFQGSAEAAERAAQKARAQKAPLLYARALSLKAAALTDVDFHEAIRLSEEAREICGQFQDLGCLANAYHRLGNLEVDSDPESAELNLRQSLRLSRQLGNRVEEGNDLNSIGVLLSNQGRLKEAGKVYEELLSRQRDDNSPWGVQMVLNNLGEDQIRQGSLAEALSNEQQALAIAKQIGLKAGEGDELLDIGQIRELEGDLGAAEKCDLEALALFERIQSTEGIALAHASLGSIARYRGDATSARNHYEASIEMLARRGDSSELAASRLGLARVDRDEGRDGDAAALGIAAAEGFHKMKRAAEEASARAFVAATYAKRGDTEAANMQALKSLQLIQGSESVLNQLDVGIATAGLKPAATSQASPDERSSKLRELRLLSLHARTAGIISLELQADLAAIELESRSGHAPVNQTSIDELKRRANRKGFLLISRQARSLANFSSAQLRTSCCGPSGSQRK